MTTTVDSIESAVAQLLPRLAQGSRLVLIDGYSGAGKSTLAQQLHQQSAASQPTRLLRLDDIYPGWDGLAAGADEVAARVVVPLSQGQPGWWRPYDWQAGTKGAPVRVDPGPALIIEGVGALHPDSAAHASARVWVDAPTAVRRERALARDGDTYRPHWDRWAAQEAAYLQTDPLSRADLIVHLAGKDTQ